MGGIGLSMSSSSDACLFEAFLSDGFCSSFLNGEIFRDRLACGAGLSERRAGSGRGSPTSRELKLSSCTGSGATLARPSTPGSLRTFGAGAFCSLLATLARRRNRRFHQRPDFGWVLSGPSSATLSRITGGSGSGFAGRSGFSALLPARVNSALTASPAFRVKAPTRYRVGALTLKAGLAVKALFTRAGNKAEKPERPAKPEPEPPVIRDKVADEGPDNTQPKSGRWWNRLFRRRAKVANKEQKAPAPKVRKEPGVEGLANVAPEPVQLESFSSREVGEPRPEPALRSDKPAPQASRSLKISPFKKDEQKPSDKKASNKQASLLEDIESPIPPISLLDPAEEHKEKGYSEESLEHMSRLQEEKLADFGVSVEVVEVNPGPVITRFEIKPAAGVKVSKISNLAKDLARSLAVLSVRVVEVIPGKSVVGIEIPNEEREIVRLSEVLGARVFTESSSALTLALGNDIGGNPMVANLAKMPHLLVAGTTGSGKSVGVNAMLLSMLLKATPEEVRFIMVDPKMLELSIYDGIPHLLAPVVTDMKEAANALRWCVAEMERRYRLMASLGVRNIAGYNKKVKDARAEGEPLLDPLWKPDEYLANDEQERPELETLPFIVVVIDEFADMMMIVGKKVEELIARIAQKARAAGIHLILATQRPSVDVITGLIKANIPTRISFQVSSKIDSRTVLDQGGAEQLLGHGDMLYLPPGSGLPVRVHGAFVDDDEVHRVVSAWKARGEPEYVDDVLNGAEGENLPGVPTLSEGGGGDEGDALFDEAVAFVTENRRVSISSVQRKFKIGYNRAANLVDAMEASGVVSPAGHNGAREVLAPPPPRD